MAIGKRKVVRRSIADRPSSNKSFCHLMGKSSSSRLVRPVTARLNLNSAWRMACNRVDSKEWTSPPSFISLQNQLANGFLHYKSQDGDEPVSHTSTANANQATTEEATKVVVVDATELRSYWNEKQRTADGRYIGRLDKEIPPPKKTMLQIRNPYAVPLCLGGTSSMPWQEHAHEQPPPPMPLPPRPPLESQPFQHLGRRVHEQHVINPKYAVPSESFYQNRKKGKRYCGNFYYL